MALQLRRGTDAQRLALGGVNTPLVGEPLFTTDTKKLFIGDGSTAGGVALGYYSSVAVSGQDTLTANNNTDVLTLVAGTNINITTNAASDSITISAAATFTELKNESIRIFQNNIVGLNSNEDIVINPSGTGKVDLIGNLTVSGTINGNLTGNVTGNVSGSAATVTASSQPAITSLGTLTGLSVSGTVNATSFSGPLSGNVTGNVNGNVTGNVTGNLEGDVVGSVFADNSTTLVDSVAGVLRGLHIGTLETDKIRINDDKIITLSSNQDLFIEPAGTGKAIFRSTVTADRLELFNDPSNSGIIVGSQGSTNAPFIISTTHNSASVSPAFVTNPSAFTGPQIGATVTFLRAKGPDLLSPQTVVLNDEIAAFDFNGFYQPDSAFYSAAKIKGVVDGAAGSSIVPGRLEFLATNSTGTSAVRLTVSSTAVTAAVPFRLPVVADDTARTALVASPAKGMLIFMESGTTPAATNQAQVYDGTNWVNL